MAFLQRSPKISFSIAKIAGALIAIAAAAAAVAGFAVPYFVAALSGAVPRLWSSVRFFLVPPYLFITIHLIIVAIWKLSEQKAHRKPNCKPSDAVRAVDRNVTPSKPASEDIAAGSDDVTPISASKSAESCVTTESDENSAVSSRFESKEGEDAALALDLEDTWQTIVMKKSATWERSSDTVVEEEEAGERAVRRSVTFKESPVPEVNDELNQRFEAFIKKNYDQIRSY